MVMATMKRSLLVIASGAAVGLVAFWLMSGATTSGQIAPQGQADAYAAGQSNRKVHFPSSADKVKISAWMSPKPPVDNAVIKIQLHIQKGWHVNANPASLRFLIPTTLHAESAGRPVRLDVRYPVGRDSNITLGGKKIAVYDDKIILTARFPQAIVQPPALFRTLTILATVQSCTDRGICLAPAQLSVSLGRSHESRRG